MRRSAHERPLMTMAEPAWLVLLALAPLPWIWERRRPRLAWPTLTGFQAARGGWASRLAWARVLLRVLAIACLAVALARPRTVLGQKRIAGRGVAIVVAIDQSSSMEARDFPDGRGGVVSRLQAAKHVLAGFVAGRPDDLIGLVAFANYPDLVCPPTLDHDFLVEVAQALGPARPGDDGTNIGDAIAWSLDALRKAPPRKKVLVLLTDGDNDPAVPRPLDPRAAAQICRRMGVVLHTIAVGQAGGIARAQEPNTGLMVPFEVNGPNLELLQELAAIAGGRSFRATDTDGLAGVFQAIDALERSPVEGTIRTRYREWYPAWVGAALTLLFLDWCVTLGPLRRLP